MKRKDFLQRMRSRRRRDELELREPERRRAIDWRTLRVELPAEGSGDQALSIGSIDLLPEGIRLHPTEPCWVRGYRVWRDEEGQGRAEFQYRPVAGDSEPPPGATALRAKQEWAPAAS